MKRSITLLVVLMSVAFARWPVLEPVESLPAEVGGLEFTVVTETSWGLHGPDIELQLRITNPGEEPILFPTFDTLTPKITSEVGEEIELHGGRDGAGITRNILLRPEKGYSYPLAAKLLESKNEGGTIFEIRDRTGTWWTSKSITSGKYSLSFELRPTHFDFEKSHKLPAPLWAAKGSTNAVEFQINLGESISNPLEE